MSDTAKNARKRAEESVKAAEPSRKWSITMASAAARLKLHEQAAECTKEIHGRRRADVDISVGPIMLEIPTAMRAKFHVA